ncbi:MAG: AhpC/TSA family protein [Anaerolineales bacterium]|nr:AhpC/TSA family protein [Anaerolineales bacterium]
MSRYAEIQALGVEVLAISFGTPYWANVWLQETGAPFPLLLDPERAAYHAYGLQSSVFRSWVPKNLWYYVKAVLQGRELLGKRGDPHQLGGDFLVDRRGIIRLAHPSADPTDRPAVAKLMRVLEEM